MDWKFQKEDDLREQLQLRIKSLKTKSSVAVFDADGSLWAEDINDLFLDYQHDCGKPHSQALFRENYQGSSLDRCRDIALSQSGTKLQDFKTQIQSFLKKQELTLFPFQKKLLSFLKKEGVSVWIVTASLKILVEEALLQWRSPQDKVLGMGTELEKGVLGSQLLQPLTYGAGKKQALLKNFKQEEVLLACGNSISDLPFLEVAQIPIVIHFAKPEEALYESEKKLKLTAQQRNWFVFEA